LNAEPTNPAGQLPTDLASQVLGQLGLQYALAVAGTALIALGVGWLAAGRALAPIRTIVATLRRISDDRLDARVRPSGPQDELHELAVDPYRSQERRRECGR